VSTDFALKNRHFIYPATCLARRRLDHYTTPSDSSPNTGNFPVRTTREIKAARVTAPAAASRADGRGFIACPSGVTPLDRPRSTGVHVERSCGALDGLLRDHDFLDPSRLGRSNMESRSMASMMERSPRAPVLRSIAFLAMAPSASPATVRSTPSISNSR
jgi:hypothetical protein